MSILDWFAKQKKEHIPKEKLNIPGDLWVKCFSCGEILYNKELEENLKVCSKCGYHFRLTAEERMAITIDEDSFEEFSEDIKANDFLGFVDTQSYKDRLKKSVKRAGKNEAIVTGFAKINGIGVVIGIMDFGFMGGSMGSVVGEKVTIAIEKAIEKKRPLLIVTASGGARMQEGVMSLMQMAKTSAALRLLHEAKLPYVCLLTDPTTGGTSASYGMLGDVQIAEPCALIGFAGPRVIEQTIRQKLPKGFQTSEYLLEHGMMDMVVIRKDVKGTISKILKVLLKSRIRKR